HAGFVHAEREASWPGRPGSVPGLSIRMNGALVDSVEDPGDVIDPLGSLRWLAGRLAGFGLRLAKGHVILTGSRLRVLPVAPVVAAGNAGVAAATARESFPGAGSPTSAEACGELCSPEATGGR